jgi:hypothetical protein
VTLPILLENMKLLAVAKKTSRLFIAVEKTVYGTNIDGPQGVVFQEYVLEAPENGANILSIEIDESETYLVAVWTNKMITCWNIQDGKLLGRKAMKKKSGALAVATWKKNSNHDHVVAIVGDRAGDIWGFNIPELKKEVLLGGHTASVITDIAYSPENNLILTSDRDEKVRYSSFPDIESIAGYSLGHTSVVSSITPINKDCVSSIGWDHKLIIWNFSDFGKIEERLLSSVNTFTLLLPPSQEIQENVVDQINDGSDANNKEEEEEEEEDEEEQQQLKDGEKLPGEDAEKEPEEENNAEAAAENNDVNEEEDGDNKNYNESEFGHYPLKISSAMFSSGELFLSVIFKEEKKMEICEYSSCSSSSLSSSLSFVRSSEISLADIPLDVLSFSSSNYSPVWIVLLPAPTVLQVFGRRTSSNSSEGGEVVDITKEFFSEELLIHLRNNTSNTTSSDLLLF